ncbi:MAG: toprim domain-containing protein [Planctomycetes bacterium]|nr:toprim domain-containing protein [Planctomycetota bacterium]
MIRVNKNNPCKICLKPDWCVYSEDGQVAICARISEGSKKRCGDAGWLHVIGPDTGQAKNVKFNIQKPDNKPKPDFDRLVRSYQERLSDRQLRWLGESLGISPISLQRLGVGWDGKSFTFPMSDENQKIIGIRRRYGDGRKFAVKGSCNGLFIPQGLSESGPLFITEGPTDCGAALDLGFDSIGRPNCDSKVDMTVRFARGSRITIVADNDAVGIAGAKKLSAKLIECCPEVKIITPPLGIKDLRQWKQLGLSKGWNNDGS